MHPRSLLPRRASYQWGTIRSPLTLQSKDSRTCTILADLTPFHTRMKSHSIPGRRDQGDGVGCSWQLLHLLGLLGYLSQFCCFVWLVGQHQDSDRGRLWRLACVKCTNWELEWKILMRMCVKLKCSFLENENMEARELFSSTEWKISNIFQWFQGEISILLWKQDEC